MARLPIPGSDDGQWGEVLNDFLSQSLDTDGQLTADSVGPAQLQQNAVTADAIAPGAVDSTALASNAVTKADIGLSNVDNTSDADKPVSTAVAALDAQNVKLSGDQSIGGVKRFTHKTTSLTGSSFVIGDDLAASTATGRSKLTIGNTAAGSDVIIGQSATRSLALGWEYVSGSPASSYGVVETFGGANHLVLQRNLGSVGIGTTTPQAKLHVWGTGTSMRVTGNAYFEHNATIVGSLSSASLGLGAAATHTLTLGSTTSGIAYYDTADQTVNYRRARLFWDSNVLNLANEDMITGNGGKLRLSTGPTVLHIGYNFGASGESAFSFERNNTGNNLVEINSASLMKSSGMQHGLTIRPVIAQTATAGYTMLHVNPTITSAGSGEQLLADFQAGSVSRFKVSSAGRLTINDGTQAAGRVLTSDASGNASWQAPTTSAAVSVASPGASYDITTAMFPSVRTITLSANLTLTLSAAPAAGSAGTITLVLKQAPSGGPYTVTWPTSLEWPSDALGPAMPTTANAELMVHLLWTGSAWRAISAGTYFP